MGFTWGEHSIVAIFLKTGIKKECLFVYNKDRKYYIKDKWSEERMTKLLQKAKEHNKQIEIIYMDRKGDITHRMVKVIKVNPCYFKGYCYLRHQQRIFALNNILAISLVANNKKDGYEKV